MCLFVQLMEWISPVGKLDGKVEELACGLEKVTALLQQRSATVDEAQNVLKVRLGALLACV